MGSDYKYGRSKLVLRHAANQSRLINEDSTILIDREAEGTLSESEIIKFRLLIGREPKLKKRGVQASISK